VNSNKSTSKKTARSPVPRIFYEHIDVQLLEDHSTMRVFLVQTAKGLSSSSGGYRANLSLLKYLAHRGHAAAQLCFVWDQEVKAYCDEMVIAGLKPDLQAQNVWMPIDERSGISMRTYTFTSIDGVKNVAINASDFEKALPNNVVAGDTAKLIEVGPFCERDEE
jgi:hypothetical protein